MVPCNAALMIQDTSRTLTFLAFNQLTNEIEEDPQPLLLGGSPQHACPASSSSAKQVIRQRPFPWRAVTCFTAWTIGPIAGN